MSSAVGTTSAALPTGYSATGGIATDTVKVALFNNSATPDKTATLANTAYGSATDWPTGDEVTSTNWAAGGIALTSTSFSLDTGSSSMIYHAANTAGGGTVTLTGFYGCLVYDTSISAPTASQGYCFNYFGGTQTVTAGTFTIIWPTPSGAATTAVFNIAV
jgi:hypothetical protein